MSTLGFYTSPTTRVNQLLRAYPQMTSLSRRNANVGEVRTDDLETQLRAAVLEGLQRVRDLYSHERPELGHLPE